MTSSQLPNYLLSNRKRLGLSQDELAFLLGTGSGAKVCRDERFSRIPSLEAALAYEAVFGRPVRELFSGLYQRIERDVMAQAKMLVSRLEGEAPSPHTMHKLQTLADLMASAFNNPLNS